MAEVITTPNISTKPNIGAPMVIYLSDSIAIAPGVGDPSQAPGVAAGLGSLLLTSTGVYRKSGAADTQWTNLVSEAFLGDVPPTSPSASDDGFTSAADLTNWTQVGTPTITYPSNAPSWININTPSSGSQVRGIQKTVNSAADWSITAKMSPTRDLAGNTNCGILITDNVGTGIIFGIADSVSGYTQLSVVLTATYGIGGLGTAAAAYNVTAGIGIIFLRVTYTQSTNRLNFYYSPDGIAWSRVFINVTPAVTITRAGVALRGNGAPQDFLVDWVRYTP